MPDVRALQVYLRGLADKSQDLRKASSAAIAAIRDAGRARSSTSSPPGRSSPPAALPELRKIFSSIQPVKDWHVVGPFPFDDRPPVRSNKPVDLTATVARPRRDAARLEGDRRPSASTARSTWPRSSATRRPVGLRPTPSSRARPPGPPSWRSARTTR